MCPINVKPQTSRIKEFIHYFSLTTLTSLGQVYPDSTEHGNSGDGDDKYVLFTGVTTVAQALCKYAF